MSVEHPAASANENAEAALARARRRHVEPVLIAGGGIGGLATAIALAQRGIASHVLERRSIFDEEGAGIQLGPNGTRILKQLGVSDRLRPHVGVPEAICVREGASGRELARLPLGRWIAMRHGAPYWVAQRSDLHAALLAAVEAEPLIALTMGFGVAEVAVDDDMVAVATDTGAAWTGRALIAADGVWSLIRRQYFKGGEPRFAGKSAARCVLPINVLGEEFHKPETGIWLFANAHVVHYPVAAGNALAVVVIVSDEHDDADWNTPVPPAWVHQRLPACAAPLRSLISTARTWRRWTLHTLPVVPYWSRGPVALLGDAAHPVLPFLAQGGAMALEDAAVVAEALDRFAHNVPAALRWYASARRPRTVRVAKASRRNGRIYHFSGPLAAARNLALRKRAPDRLMARYDWLYDWRLE